MVLRLKTRESRSLPGLPSATIRILQNRKSHLFSSHNRPKPNKTGRPQGGLFNAPDWETSGTLTSCVPYRRQIASGNLLRQCSKQSKQIIRDFAFGKTRVLPFGRAKCRDSAGWSSPVARQAHNLKAAGSNPAPATKLEEHTSHVV